MLLKSKEKGIVQFNNSTVATATMTTKEQYFEINILARANCVRIRVQQSRKKTKEDTEEEKERKTNQTNNAMQCDSNEKESILGAVTHSHS